MNSLLKRVVSAYIILVKNKLIVSMMMLVSGIMMAVGAANGHGNDIKTIPIILTSAGVMFSIWAFYRVGYIKANYDRLEDKMQKDIEKRVLVLQVFEASAYVVVTVAGIYLLLNESLMNLILNIVAGVFTTFNGIVGTISLFKRFKNRNYRWVIRLILTIFELIAGPYFIIMASSIDISELLIMGILTAVAGIIEVFSAYSKEYLIETVRDGKSAVSTLKTGKADKK